HLAPYPPQDTYTSDSDVEAAAGLAALRMAEEQEEADEARRRTGGGGLFSEYTSMHSPRASLSVSQPAHESASDSDYPPVDLGSYGGNFAPHFAYGGDPNELASGTNTFSSSHPVSTSGSQRRS